MKKHICGNCKYWDIILNGKRLGDCKAPNDHRYSRVPMGDGSFAMLDSFGPEETKEGFICGVWKQRAAEGGA